MSHNSKDAYLAFHRSTDVLLRYLATFVPDHGSPCLYLTCNITQIQLPHYGCAGHFVVVSNMINGSKGLP